MPHLILAFPPLILPPTLVATTASEMKPTNSPTDDNQGLILTRSEKALGLDFDAAFSSPPLISPRSPSEQRMVFQPSWLLSSDDDRMEAEPTLAARPPLLGLLQPPTQPLSFRRRLLQHATSRPSLPLLPFFSPSLQPLSLSKTKPANPHADDSHNCRFVGSAHSQAAVGAFVGCCRARARVKLKILITTHLVPSIPPMPTSLQVVNTTAIAHCRWHKSDAPVSTARSLVYWPFEPPETTIVVDQEQVRAEGLIFARSEKPLGLEFDARSLRLLEPTFDFTQEPE